MRAGWKTMKLDDACFVDYGTRVVRKRDGGTIYPVYGGGGATFRMDTYNREDCLVVARFAMSQTCTRFVQGKFFLNDSGLTLRAKDKDLSQVFLDWIITSKNDLIYSFGKGSAQKNLDMEDFRNMEISFPISLAEQQRIVDILDQEFAKIDALKANAEKSLQAAKDLFQATLKKELEPKEGWTYLRLNDIYNFIDYRGSTPTKLTEGIPLITAKNIKMGYLDYSIKDFISPEEYEHRQSRGVSHRGDILFTTEAPLGNVAIADKDVFSAGQRVITFQQYPNSTKQLNNRFYLYYFLSPSFQETLKEQATGATAQGIKASRLKEIKVPLVAIRIQKSITERLDELNEKCGTLQRNYQKTLSLCDDLKLSLLRKAFNGEL